MPREFWATPHAAGASPRHDYRNMDRFQHPGSTAPSSTVRYARDSRPTPAAFNRAVDPSPDSATPVNRYPRRIFISSREQDPQVRYVPLRRLRAPRSRVKRLLRPEHRPREASQPSPFRFGPPTFRCLYAMLRDGTLRGALAFAGRSMRQVRGRRNGYEQRRSDQISITRSISG